MRRKIHAPSIAVLFVFFGIFLNVGIAEAARKYVTCHCKGALPPKHTVIGKNCAAAKQMCKDEDGCEVAGPCEDLDDDTQEGASED